MKKKGYGIIVSIMVIIAMLSSVLVACVKQDDGAEPTAVNKGNIASAINESNALGDVMNGWLAANNWNDKDKIGWDVSVDYNTGTANANDLDIIFKGGIDNSGNSLIDFAIINKSYSDKVEFGLQLLGDKFNITIQDNSYTNNELGINDFSLVLPTDGSISSGINTTISIASLLFSAGVTLNSVEPVLVEGAAAENGSIYDINYNFTLDVHGSIMNIIDLVGAFLGDSVSQDNIDKIKSVLDNALDGMVIGFDVALQGKKLEVSTTKDEDKNEVTYAYKFSVGTVSSDAFDLAVTASGDEHSVKIDGLKLTNEIPTIVEPADAREIFILKHELSGVIASSNLLGQEVSKFDYKFNFEFSAKGLVKAIISSIEQTSSISVMNLIFADQDGKMFLDITHKCSDSEVSCNGHMSTKIVGVDKNFNGSLLSIAYDPASFGTKSVYGSINIAALLPGDFMETLEDILVAAKAGIDAGTVWNTALKPYLPVDTSFVINPLLVNDYYTNKGSVQAVADVHTDTAALDLVGILDKLSAIDFDVLIKTIAGNLEDGILDIDASSIRDLVAGLELDDSTAGIIGSLVDMLIGNKDGISNIALSATYKNGATLPEDLNIKDAFMNSKDFSHDGAGITPAMKGPVGSEITFDKTEKFVHVFGEDRKNNDLQSAEGIPNPFSYEEFMTGISNTETNGIINPSTSRYVKANYTDICGNVIENSKMYIMDVKGLDASILDKPQDITLVLTRGTGQGVYTILDNIMPLLKMFDIIKEVPDLSIPEATVKTTITLRKFISEEWTQEHIREDLRLSDKEYEFGDKVAVEQRYVRKYSGDTQIEYIPTITYKNSVTDVSNITATDVFVDPFNTVDGATVSYFRDVVICYDVLGYAGVDINRIAEIKIKSPVQGIITKEYYNTQKVEINPTTVINPSTGQALDTPMMMLKPFIDAFVAANSGVTVDTISANDTSFIINFPTVANTAVYQLEAEGVRGDKVLFKFTVKVNSVVGYKVGFLQGAAGMSANFTANEKTFELNSSTEQDPFAWDLDSGTFSMFGTGTTKVFADGSESYTKSTPAPLVQIVAYVKVEGEWVLVTDTSATSTVIQITTSTGWTKGTKIMLKAAGEYKLTYQPLKDNHPDVDGIPVSLDLVTIYVSATAK